MDVIERYRHFAEVEAKQSSPVLASWAALVAEDAELLDRIGSLPAAKQQANLVFAAVRRRHPQVVDPSEFRAAMLSDWDGVRLIALTRATQTNEPGRCALLLPALAAIDGPIALIEVGSSAGLCLLPDRYSYRYATADGDVVLDPADGPSTVELPCRLEGIAAPSRMPEIVWRAGIDRNPLDPASPETAAWLDALIWPEHEDRRVRMDAALALAARTELRVVRGDANDELAALAAEAPGDATLVVFHSAVLMYFDAADRERFAENVRRTGATWISNEGWSVLPEVRAQVPHDPRHGFVLAVDGRATALAEPHGRSLLAVDPAEGRMPPSR